MNEMIAYIEQIIAAGVYKIILSKPVSKEEPYKKIIMEYKESFYQIASYTEKQVFHENIELQNLCDQLESKMNGHYLQANAWSQDTEYMLMISKKGKCSFKKRSIKNVEKEAQQSIQEHNRKKNYILEEGTRIPPLVDMGVFTAEGKVVHAMYDKYKQINRFLEILDDEIADIKTDEVNVIDFGCGKSYLTFVVYYYLTEIRKKKARVVGLDLKESVIRNCNIAAKKYGYDGLHFELGDINGYQNDFPVDIVITLHACDTATDYALYNAILWNAKMIFSVPCCQHELNKQMKTEQFSLMTRYGIIQERFAALTTDAIRANLLEYSGYKTQLLEFIDFEHTPKNILIRAVRRPVTSKGVKQRALREVEDMINEFNLQPTLYQLLDISESR